MIATTLSGGLGNQMFMYAMVRAMSLRNGTDVAFNTQFGFKNDSLYHRDLELQHFNVQLEESTLQTFDYGVGRYVRVISRKIGRNILHPSSKFIIEQHPLRFQKELLCEKGKNLYLEGYWQSEDYFKDYENVIRNDFKIKTKMPDNIHNELASWRSDGRQLVFVGIRRYQECKSTTPGMVLGEDYYNKAIELMETKLNNPKFIVFTQEREWAKTHVKSSCPIVFAEPKKGDLSTIEDMFLMTQCDHAIISNSSYYWWGAWLQNTDKNNHVVVSSNNFVNQDSVCDNWIII
jgi:hypothetical protein